MGQVCKKRFYNTPTFIATDARLKKEAAYWLIKHGHFKVIIVDKKMWIMVDSFEEWYASQFHYKKVDGHPRIDKESFEAWYQSQKHYVKSEARGRFNHGDNYQTQEQIFCCLLCRR